MGKWGCCREQKIDGLLKIVTELPDCCINQIIAFVSQKAAEIKNDTVSNMPNGNDLHEELVVAISITWYEVRGCNLNSAQN
jgi:hypothetical protein